MGRFSPAKVDRLIPNGPVMIASQTPDLVVCILNGKVVQNPSVHLRTHGFDAWYHDFPDIKSKVHKYPLFERSEPGFI